MSLNSFSDFALFFIDDSRGLSPEELVDYIKSIIKENQDFRKELKNINIELNMLRKNKEQFDELMEAYERGEDINEYIGRKIAESC